MQSLNRQGVNVSTPTQSAIHKSETIKQKLKTIIQNRFWALHFDGKRVNGTEYQVVVLKNSEQELRISALTLPDGKSLTIFNALVDVLNEYNAWNQIKVIITDSTNVNTGNKNGVVTLL